MNRPQQLNWTSLFLSSPMVPTFLVFGIGFLIRCVAMVNLHIINPDGVFYIYQAKAISSGQWNLLNDCALSYITLYPFLIALFQVAISQWVLSAQLVSLCFGSAMLIPLYLILRQFFNCQISQLTTFMFALIPVFVRYSVDAMRDPTYWFFFTAAIWVFLLHTRRGFGSKKSMGFLVLSSCLTLLAALTRIEAIILYPASCLYIILADGERKPIRLFGFIFPVLFLGGAGALFAIHTGVDILSLVRWDDIAGKFFAPVTEYQNLRDYVGALARMHRQTLLGEFLPNARSTIWLIALGTILNNALEAFFYLYVPFFAVGIGVGIKQINRQSPVLYPVIILILSFFLLYAHVLQTWIMTYRFIVLLIIPSCVFAGFGIGKIIDLITRAFKLSEIKAVCIVAVFILVVGIAKNVKSIESDKAVYVQLGSKVGTLSNGSFPVGIAAKPSTAHLWVTFYTNAQSRGPVCHKSFEVNPESIANLKSTMKSEGIHFFLWEESLWKNNVFGGKSSDFLNDFEELGRWHHDDPGDLVLFRLKTGR